MLGQHYENYVHGRAQRISKGEEADHNLSQDQLKDMLASVRKRNGTKKTNQ